MTTLSPTRTCAACGELLRGRSDKKFCDYDCRNNYNNTVKSNEHVVRSINNLLRTNRRILKMLLNSTGRRPAIIFQEELLRLGFNFGYYTHSRKRETGRSVFYCYEFGYFMLDNGNYQIVRQAELVELTM